MSSKNSIIGDSVPVHQIPEPETPKVQPKSDWVKAGKSKKYQEIHDYIEVRKEYYRHFLPDGTKISEAPDEVVASWWKCAAEIISEYENFQHKIRIELEDDRVQG